MKRSQVLLLLLLIVIVGVALRGYQLTARSLWFDEAFSWRLIQFPLSEMIARDAADVHPPIYYLLLQGWAVVFGSSLLSLRSFSVAAGALTIVTGYLFGAEAFKSRTAGLVSAVLLAIVGYQIQFAWEARMYTLGTALVLLSAWLLLKAIDAKRWALGWWLAYGLSIAAFAYVHYYALFSIVAQVIFIAGYILVATRGRIGEILQLKTFWLAALAGLCLVLLYIPWVPTFLAQSRQVQQSYWIPPMGGWSVPDTFYRMFIPTDGAPPHSGLGIVAAVLPIILVILSWVLLVTIPERRHKPASTAMWLVMLSAVVPFAISVALSVFGRSLYQDRYFVFADLFIIVGVAGLLARIPWSRFRWSVITVLCIGLLLAYGRYWQALNFAQKPGAHAATQLVYREITNGEPVIVSSPFVYFAILHYAQEEFQVKELPKLYSETGELSHFAGGPILKKEDVIGKAVFETDNKNLWIVDTTGFGGQPLVVPKPWYKVKTTIYQEVFPYQGDVIVNKYARN